MNKIETRYSLRLERPLRLIDEGIDLAYTFAWSSLSDAHLLSAAATGQETRLVEGFVHRELAHGSVYKVHHCGASPPQ